MVGMDTSPPVVDHTIECTARAVWCFTCNQVFAAASLAEAEQAHAEAVASGDVETEDPLTR